MTTGLKAGICAIGLAALVALAGCGDDEDSKSDAGRTTGTERPSRGFEQDGRSEPRFFVMRVFFSAHNGQECKGYVLSPRSGGGSCENGAFQGSELQNPGPAPEFSPFWTTADGRGASPGT